MKFTWLRAHNDNMRNEIDQLAKNAGSRRDGETAYSRNSESAVVKVMQKR